MGGREEIEAKVKCASRERVKGKGQQGRGGCVKSIIEQGMTGEGQSRWSRARHARERAEVGDKRGSKVGNRGEEAGEGREQGYGRGRRGGEGGASQPFPPPSLSFK